MKSSAPWLSSVTRPAPALPVATPLPVAVPSVRRIVDELRPWEEQELITIRELWLEGLSTNKIASRMKRSKNAIVGKAHRLGLPGRPSPINLGGRGGAPPPAPRVNPSTLLPKLESVEPLQIDNARTGPSAMRPARKPAPPPPAPNPPLPTPITVIARTKPVTAFKPAPCCWPTWTDQDKAPGGPYWTMLHEKGCTPTCGAPVIVRTDATGQRVQSPYCQEHHARAFNAVRGQAA